MPIKPPSPKAIRAIAEALGESYKTVKSPELIQNLIRGLTENPQLMELLSQVRGKLGKFRGGMSDALQEAVAGSLEGRKAPQLISSARKARSVAIGEHIGGAPEATAEAAKLAKEPLTFPASAPFRQAGRGAPRPDDPRLIEAGRMLVQQMTPSEAKAARSYAVGEQTASDYAQLSKMRARLLKRPPEETGATGDLLEFLDRFFGVGAPDPGRTLYQKGGPRPPRPSPRGEEVQRTPEEVEMAYRRFMSTPVQKEIPIPAKKWRGEAAPRSYAQMLPEKEVLPEIRPGPLKTQHGPSTPPPKTFDPSAPKIEVAPEELFENPEIQRLYRRIILGKE